MVVSRFVWALGLSLMMGLAACGSESDGGSGSLLDLGIDDGASGGASTSALVTKDKAAEMTLQTGAGVKVPKGAVDADIELGLKRPPDSEARALVKRLDSKQSVVSAPYVVTPHGTKFKTDVEVTLPIGKSHDRNKLKVRWLEDEKDTRWKDLGPPQVEGNKATIKVDHFSVLVLVEDSSDGPADVPADASRPIDPENDAGSGGTDDAGDVADDDAGSEPGSDGSVGQGPDSGTSTGSPADTVLSALPIDLAADCPAAGCTLQLEAMQDGVWADCPELADATNFDPETFDFESACAEAAPDQGDITFVHAGVTRNWEMEFGYCSAWTESLSPSGTTLFQGECAPGYGEIGVEGQVRRMADGTLFTYAIDDCAGTCSATLYLQVFRPGDTTALNAGCASAAEQYDQTCAVAGTVLPFGASGVGALASALRGTTWQRCEDGVDPVEACSSVAADPLANGYLSLLRFNDDDLDELSYESPNGWDATCGVPAGADATELRIFWCADPSDPDGWGALRSTWEIRRIAARDYLLISEPNDDALDIYVSAPEDLIPSQDPCSTAPALICVIQ